MRDSESTLKIKVRSRWTFFKTLLMSEVMSEVDYTISSKVKILRNWQSLL